MKSISTIKQATKLKKKAKKVHRQKVFFAQIPHSFIQCTVTVLGMKKNSCCGVR